MNGVAGRILDLIDRVLHPEGHAKVVGVYKSHKECLAAIAQVQDDGFRRLIVHSPIPSVEIEKSLEKRPSIVRYFTLAGAIAGGAGGFLLASWASLQWNLVTGGKPIISIPPFLIITFECTILLGALATFAGFFHASRMPQPKLSDAYIEKFGEDRFGIGIVCEDSELARAEDALRNAGAEEVYRAPA